MAEREGVIKYRLDQRPGPAPALDEIAAIEAWRRILFELRLVGRDPDRYQGLGYGNVSCRSGTGFLISASQTGHLPRLTPAHYCRVLRCDPQRNQLAAEGMLPPSSEALTHGAVYAADATVNAVLHVHGPALWRAGLALGWPATPATVPYGTPAMAAAVADLVRQAAVRERGVIVMAGHQDGMLAFGADVEQAGRNLLGALGQAYLWQLREGNGSA